MRPILKIAKTELKMLFTSPISWFLLIVLVLQCSAIFTGLYSEFTHVNEWDDGKQWLCSSRFIMRMWNSTIDTLYYYIPLLTMSIISKELNTGSIKLLYSSPITNAQIVFGKFLSTITFALAVCVILATYLTVAAVTIKDFELGAALTGLLGIFLVTSTYIAIGIFMSSLTKYQFVAAIGTFAILMVLTVIGGLWQEYDLVREITYWLSISGRAFTFVTGMICSEDLLYFPIVTLMFLSLSIIRLNSKRQRVSRIKTFSQYGTIVLITCLVAFFSSRPKLMCYYDATNNKKNTLTKQSQDIIKQLDGELKITGYANVLNSNYDLVSFPYFVQENRELFKLYERFKPDTKLKMVYYYDSITPDDRVVAAASFQKMLKKSPGLTLKERADKVAESYRINPRLFKSPEYLEKRGVDLSGERTMVWVLEHKGKKVFLRTYPEDMRVKFPQEGEISAALKALVTKLHKVAAVKGNGMRTFERGAFRNYFDVACEKDLKLPLINQGFDVDNVDITNGVPKDVDILVVSDMMEPLSKERYRAIKEYIEEGKNLMILGDFNRKEIINPLLMDLLGVKLMDGVLVQYRKKEVKPYILTSVPHSDAKKKSYLMSPSSTVAMSTVAAIEKVADKGFDFEPLFVTDTLLNELGQIPKESRSYAVWSEKESLDLDLGRLECNPEADEQEGEYTTIASLSRKIGDKEQRIVVCGDAEFLSSDPTVQGEAGGANQFTLRALMHYLSNNEMPFDTRRPLATDNRVKVTAKSNKIIHRFFMIILPLGLLLTAFIIWLRRRSR